MAERVEASEEKKGVVAISGEERGRRVAPIFL